MIVKKGNLLLRRITIDDIELVRNWRNSQQVKQYMAFRDHITPEMQLAWFQSINNQNNMYFIFEYKDEKVGIFNVKDINWQERTMETGIFIAEEKYINTEIPLLAVLSFAELGLKIFNMSNFAHILKSNKRAIRYNKMLGFELCEGQEDFENQRYKLNKKRFYNRTDYFRPALYKLMGVKNTVIVFDAKDSENALAPFLISEMDPSLIKEIIEQDDSTTINFHNM